MSATGSFASVWPDGGDFRSTPVNADILRIGGHVSKVPKKKLMHRSN